MATVLTVLLIPKVPLIDHNTIFFNTHGVEYDFCIYCIVSTIFNIIVSNTIFYILTVFSFKF